MTTQEVIEMFGKYVIGNYSRLPRVIAKGKGSYIYDLDGNKILDLFPGWAVSGIGHCHPKVVKAIQQQAKILLHMDNTFYTELQGRLAQMLSERAFGGKCFFCNSGAEANESALKLARISTEKKKYKYITTLGSFHGRTFGAMTATAQPKKFEPFQPVVPGFVYVPFNDIDAMTKAFDNEVAGVMLEPIQGEGGVNVATTEYMRAIRQLCDKNGARMILDEVQTGMGRTGKWFGYQHFDVVPDIITLAKTLGGGAAIGAMMAKPEIAAALVPGTHASTFGGNCIACAAGIATIEAIDEEAMIENSIKMGKYAFDKLNQLKKKYDVIDHIRGKGLMIGIQLKSPGADIVAKCLEKGLRINCTQDTVLRFMPAMNVKASEIDKAVKILDNVMSDKGA
ncbi:MAG TPA: aspartate aminotransferase family protein [Phycisphaerales bacterium]|nr:MAG: acetylornithine aminotransferase [Planctomycetes bacterium GWC2_45_44]HBG78171.1 aspartate aminotransferase family protein [Phycisphaerales bacterium]HBR19033.1 aspartate aminotransferase family protein [Phycisphaerales bacterium]